MSKISDGSGGTFWCQAKRKDGKPCGCKVPTPGICWQHRRQAERKRARPISG